MLEIDGSFGEGGGQIIRSSISLAAIFGKAIHITKVRAKREKPGLQAQHLMAVASVGKICSAQTKDLYRGSKEIFFYPGPIGGGRYHFDIQTAGSAIMVAQALIPVLLFAKEPSFLTIIGGTHVPKSPSFDYFEKVFIRALQNFGAQVHAKLSRPGYYPKGFGRINVEILPSKLRGCQSWPRENITQGIIRLSNLKRDIAEREEAVLNQHMVHQVRIIEEPAISAGNSLTLWRGFCGSTVLGMRGVPAEMVAAEAMAMLDQETFDVDQHLADQLLLYAALAEGPTSYSTSTVTEHLRTNAKVIDFFTRRKVIIKEHRVEVI